MSKNKGILDDLIIKSHHTAVSVKDFDSALKFYIEMLGFESIGEIRDRCEPGFAEATGVPNGKAHWAMLKNDNYHIELFQWVNPIGELAANRQCDLGYTHIALQVKNIDAAYEKVIASGFKTLSPPLTLRGGAAKAIYIQAPEDNITELVEYRD
tara:strand:+ start:42219 stop:42680 length:462 start_codon:yes stop_codon:yes gene_type:complete